MRVYELVLGNMPDTIIMYHGVYKNNEISIKSYHFITCILDYKEFVNITFKHLD